MISAFPVFLMNSVMFPYIYEINAGFFRNSSRGISGSGAYSVIVPNIIWQTFDFRYATKYSRSRLIGTPREQSSILFVCVAPSFNSFRLVAMIVPTRMCFWRILKIVWPRLCLYLLSAKLKLLKDLWILSLIAAFVHHTSKNCSWA